MKVTRFIDRKLLLVVMGPVVRHLANLLSLYLAGQGVSSGLINQVEAGVIALATVAINILFELREQGKVAEQAAFKAAPESNIFKPSPQLINGLGGTIVPVPDPWRNVPLDYDATRDRFERESG